jgi:hypothetical protein
MNDISFLYIHLIRICHLSTYIWSGYVIPPHISGPDMSFLHIHTSHPDMSFLHIHWVWKNDRSRSDGCGGMTYQDQVGVDDCHIRTRWMWRNDISG